VGFAVVDPLAKFKECSFINSRNIDGVLNIKWDHMTQTTPVSHLPNLKNAASSIPEILKAV